MTGHFQTFKHWLRSRWIPCPAESVYQHYQHYEDDEVEAWCWPAQWPNEWSGCYRRRSWRDEIHLHHPDTWTTSEEALIVLAASARLVK